LNDNYPDEEKEDEGMEKVQLEMGADVYSATFLQLIKSDKPYLHTQLTIKCFLTFLGQMLLIYLIFDSKKGTGGIFDDVSFASPNVNCVRFICACLLHV